MTMYLQVAHQAGFESDIRRQDYFRCLAHVPQRTVDAGDTGCMAATPGFSFYGIRRGANSAPPTIFWPRRAILMGKGP